MEQSSKRPENTGKPAVPEELVELSKWGRIKFGNKKLSALWVAAIFGIAGSITLALIAVTTDSAGPIPMLGGIAIALVSLPPITGIIWILIVDRNTLQGATANPEQSVESLWHDKAASGAFTDTLIIGGLGTVAITLSRVELSAVYAIAILILLSMASFGIRYFAQSRKG